jgi:kynurenine formamidase
MEMKEPKIIDLTYTLRSDMLVYPGMERPVFQWLGRVNSEGYNLTKLTMLTHTGTHIDAPKHFLDDVACVDEIPLQRLFGRANIFRYKKEPEGQEITLDDIVSSEFQLEEDQIFILETGIEKFAETKRYNEKYPFPSEEVVNWLINKKIKAYMTDATAVDPVGTKDNTNHHLLLRAGIPIVENLKNLQLIPENEEFLISALPIKLKGRDGAPCRAIAITELNN